MKPLFLAIDQGTTGTTALVFSKEGETLGRYTVEFPQHFPKPGWVEHDVAEIWTSLRTAVKTALDRAQVEARAISAIGITNQRETTVLFEKEGSKPIANAIVWQCRRTADRCEALRKEGAEDMVRKKTGLVLDAYFSATKVEWLLENVKGARARAEKGELLFGTIDSYLVHRLSGGVTHATDASNASRTLLFDIERMQWDDELLALFHVPASLLPTVVGNAELIAKTKGLDFLPDGIPITGMAGDQQAALFGQACFDVGDAKCTYGTGAFVLRNIGDKPIASRHGLVTTVGWKIANKTVYALEGSAFVAGAVVQWLRDGLGIVKAASEIEALAKTVPSSDGVVLVPALAGLGAPHWDPNARGILSGITRGTTKAHIARAALEGIALEVHELLEAMAADAGEPTRSLKVDGGAAKNDLLMQLEADLSKVLVVRPFDVESTGRGAAMLAAVGTGVLSLEDARKMVTIEREFTPKMEESERAAFLTSWTLAIKRARLS